MPRTIALVLLFSCLAPCDAQSLRIDKLEPPNWWIAMKHSEVQLMVYGQQLRDVRASFDDPRLRVKSTYAPSNSRYLFVDVDIPDDLPPREYVLRLTAKEGAVASVSFPLLRREPAEGRHQGFGPRDTIYLITPDRFANGDPKNDQTSDTLDELDPNDPRMRHGGDLRGIIRRLDYLQDLGVTAIWLNPVLENDGINSYHGYKATDLYRIDPRLGTNAEYKELVAESHERNLKVVFDHVSNHIGIRHPWIEELPEDSWLNGAADEHLSEKHFLLSIADPHAHPTAQHELKTFWFVDRMPDLNQRNPRLARYLIQNTIWWIEYSGLDGIREDTYPYADQSFLADWAKAIRTEYPNFNIVGEIWATKPAYIARFQQKTLLPRDFETHLPAVMDFPLMEAYRAFLDGSGKLRDIHATYAQDFLYTDVDNLLVFLDNHDTPRAMFQADRDARRVKLALTLMLTARGIPQLLYGTEIGMVGGKSHVELRADFPGGFPGDARNAFARDGRTAEQNEMHDHVRHLLTLRGKHAALTDGTMTHYQPTWNHDVYKVVRVLGDDKVLIVANGHDETKSVDLTDVLTHHHASRLRDLFSGTATGSNEITLDPVSARVFALTN